MSRPTRAIRRITIAAGVPFRDAMRSKTLVFAAFVTLTIALLAVVERRTRPELADEYDA